MDKKKKIGAALAAGTAAAGAAYLLNRAAQTRKAAVLQANEEEIRSRDYGDTKAYMVGGGLATLAAAAYLIRDANFNGENIIVYEGMPVLGGSNDGSGTPQDGFVCRGGRMLNEETYENFWELFSSIPSLERPNCSVTEEILDFDHAHPTCAKARVVDRNGRKLDVYHMKFNNEDRLALLKLLATPEEKLDNLKITDWFGPHFFETHFWYMWQTTFAFQKWSSLFELRRYMNRMILEFSRIQTLEGVTRTRFNQYESVILPLKTWLEKKGVTFHTNTTVTDMFFDEGNGITVNTLVLSDGTEIRLRSSDVCIMTNACMTDSATLGDWNTPAPAPEQRPISGELWAKIAAKKPGLGNPEPFFGDAELSNWQSFTVTCRGDKLLKMIEEFSGNIPGSGALMTLKDSNWLMSTVVAAQPHFKTQDADTTIFWGYALYTDRPGDYVKKPMRDCTGEEILYEWICQMHWEDRWDEIREDVINVIPCFMPYVDAQFMPRAMKDRPQVVPEGSTNFAMVSQFVEIPEDMVFTEEYSVRAARIAVYTLFGITKEICPVTPYRKDPKVLLKALHTMYR
ncbi:oleate hydratase [Bacilliculturomica massiliensis]|uniref:oleate hydratase n=1 Tax=Bacilliculturomica massiliensis TaxID=1917867 RepID=UPI00102FC873|nr:oleate hydratase [Bacilliculturomica massiliensis]